ncbi:unnamed protein product [Linum tenue]|uniref:BHLH domain-containing protein n=1 Tax=Linum tenue TaxID=586396 RepID=A0AAV0R0S5_9ROSI|nr:unnamed protein product [Linum tenue]
MALEALDYFFQQQQQQDTTFFTEFTSKDPLYSFLESTPNWTPDFDGGGGGGHCFLDNQAEPVFLHQHTDNDHHHWENYFPTLHYPSSVTAGNVTGSPEFNGGVDPTSSSSSPAAAAAEAEAVLPRGKKPRRARSRKNKEEIESQRMTHIAVERNRRKQMNDYLSVLRSLMPDSYVQRGDQASIIGGAINFVKELEQRLQHLGAILHHKEAKRKSTDHQLPPFAEFFTFPQYSSSASSRLPPLVGENSANNFDSQQISNSKTVGPRVGDVEVTMVESHASVRVRWRKQARQLLRLVAGLQSFRLSVLHLNVTTAADDDDRQTVLYSLSLKVEEDCRLNTVDEIATAVYEMLDGISQEA